MYEDVYTLNDTTIRIKSETRNALKELKNFYECGSQEIVIRQGLIALIDRSIVRLAQTENSDQIEKLCELRTKLIPKIY